MDAQTYERMKQCLQIDKGRLDEELIELPQLMLDTSEATAKAIGERDAIKNKLDRTIAEASDIMRREGDSNSRPLSEKRIENQIPLDDVVQRVQAEYDQTRYEAALWTGMMEAMRSKSRALAQITELVIAGFITADSVYAESKQAMHEKRRERARLNRQMVE